MENKIYINGMGEALLESFPNLKNLKVLDSGSDIYSVTFDECEYTKEEVEAKIIEIHNYTPDFNLLENTKIEETISGYKIVTDENKDKLMDAYNDLQKRKGIK